MNERIEKLIEQCTVQNFSDCTGGFETFDKDKFVQLIVRECCQFENSYSGDARLVSRHYVRRILEHFGVEE